MTGYQQCILYLLGCRQGERFVVRCIDRWYIDAVCDLFLTNPFLQHQQSGKKDCWCIKAPLSRAPAQPQLSDVDDWQGFARAFVELQGVLDLWKHKTKRGEPIATPRLRLYGQPDVLEAVCRSLPAATKKLQTIRTKTGTTYQIIYQSPAEIADILSHIRGDPCSRPLWSRWDQLMSGKQVD